MRTFLKFLILAIITCVIGFAMGYTFEGLRHDFQCEKAKIKQESPLLTPRPVNAEAATAQDRLRQAISGKASYYSVSGCLGCRDDRKMANGEVLDDTRLTVAYNRAPLNSQILVRNLRNGKIVIAKITDRGGFENYGKIVDLSLATKNALECNEVCNVELELL